MSPRIKTIAPRPLAQLTRLTAVAAVLVATIPAVAAPEHQVGFAARVRARELGTENQVVDAVPVDVPATADE